MQMPTNYPWQEALKERLQQQFVNGHLAHAYLLEGAEDLGKFNFAISMAYHFLCEQTHSKETQGLASSCGECTACKLLAANTHSDLHIIEPEDSKQIKIDQIRSLISWVNKTSQRNGLKIAIINPAHQMNTRSANALLKCLEEPSANTLIFLVSERCGSLLPTIRSRCQNLKFMVPNRDAAIDWLQLSQPSLKDSTLLLDISDGNPGAALKKVDNAYIALRQQVFDAMKHVIKEKGSGIEAMKVFKKPNLELLLLIMSGLISDCTKLKVTKDNLSLKNKDLDLLSLADACRVEFLFKFYERINHDLQILRGPSNPSEALLFERLMIDMGDSRV